jgi:hypothetical protein
MGYMTQKEMYEHISKLESVKDRISDKTMDELFM